MGCHQSKEKPKKPQESETKYRQDIALDGTDVQSDQPSQLDTLQDSAAQLSNHDSGAPWTEVEETYVPVSRSHSQDTGASDHGHNDLEEDPLLTKPGFEHVLALLTRLVGASALLVDLKQPPTAYIRDAKGLRCGDAMEVRSMPHYQEVKLPGHVVGTLGVATPAASPTAPLLLTQMAGVVVRELGARARPPQQPCGLDLQQFPPHRAPSLATVLPAMSLTTQQAASSESGCQMGSLLADATNGVWRVLAVEDDLAEVAGIEQEAWIGAQLWDVLRVPFGNASPAWSAVNEVAALSGDLIVTSVALPASAPQLAPAGGGLALHCTPATELALEAAGHIDWLPVAATAGKGINSDSLPYLVTLARDARDRGFATNSAGSIGYSSSAIGIRSGSRDFGESPLGGIPVPGVELGELLGKGSYGRVFHGTWHGEEVAIKVCHQGLARSGDRKVKPWAGVEAVASLQLRHRHIMRTLKHTTVVVAVQPTLPQSRSASINEMMNQSSMRTNFDLSRMQLPSVKAPSAGAAIMGASALDLAAASLRTRSFTWGRAQLGSSGDCRMPVPEEGAVVEAEAEDTEPRSSLSTSSRGQAVNSGNSIDGLKPSRRADTVTFDLPAQTIGSQSFYAAALRGAANGCNYDPSQLQYTHSGSNFGAASSVCSPVSGDMQAEIDTYVIMEYCNRGSLQRALDDGMFCFGGEHSEVSSQCDSYRDAGDEQQQQQQKPQQQQQQQQQEEPSVKLPDMLSILTAGRQLASALAYMHSRGVIHGDLSRANVLLQESSSSSCGFDVKVADFGMARQLEAGSRIDTFSCGTITHTSPELMDEGRLSPAADVYAMGVLLWELYHGKGAWTGMNQAQVISAVLIHDRRPSFDDDAPPEFAELSRSCMSLDPSSRPTCVEVEARLATMLKKLEETPN